MVNYCLKNSDCTILEECIQLECKLTDNFIIWQSVGIVLVAIMIMVLAWHYPLRSLKTNKSMPNLSAFIALLLFPVYLIVVAWQNQIEMNNEPSPATTVVVTLFCWPLLFFMMPTRGWEK